MHVCRYPYLLTKGAAKVFKHPLPATKFRASWRGGGFRDGCKEFFERMMGKYYRIPGFLATSLKKDTAIRFINRADKKHPRILWCILVRADSLLAQFEHLFSVPLVDALVILLVPVASTILQCLTA